MRLIFLVVACMVFTGCSRPPAEKVQPGENARPVKDAVGSGQPLTEAAATLDAPVQKCTLRKRSRPRRRDACIEAGGRWYSGAGCSLPTADAGKPCRDSSCCEGMCLAQESVLRGTVVVGECSAGTAFGCFNFVEDGRAKGTRCY